VCGVQGTLRQLLPRDANPRGVPTPITAVDTWISEGTGHVGSCDVYGVCALWDVEKGVQVQAFDLRQPLCDIAFGPNGLVAVVGDEGDCFLLDRTQPEGDVHVLELRARVAGPARLAWSPQRPNLFAAAWQSEEGGVALYGGAKLCAGRMLHSQGFGAVCADIAWSPACPELLCCAKEDGVVEVWEFAVDSMEMVATAAAPCFRWQASSCEVCTAMALTTDLAILATTPGQGQRSSGNHGSLSIAKLPLVEERAEATASGIRSEAPGSQPGAGTSS